MRVRLNIRAARLAACLFLIPITASADPPTTAPATASYLPLMRSHFDKVIAGGTDAYGEGRSALWLASIDVRKGGLPADPKPKHPRWYRDIVSPGGSNLYWDQAAVVAAHHVARLSGDARYRDAADRYVRDFLGRCVAPESGLFLWGNHIYYDVTKDKPAPFEGGYHEVRPHTPAWELFWAASPTQAEAAIRGLARQHVKDKRAGIFCRHGDPRATGEPNPKTEAKKAKPFLEAGGPIVQSLCWLSAKRGGGAGEPELVDLAVRVAQYSFERRGETTGLLRNQPVDKRWDYYAATTESGVWANALLAAAASSGRDEFRQMARDAVLAYVRHGWDAEAGLYYGQLDVETGRPRVPPAARQYMPPKHAVLFDDATFPTHNYPMSMADACLTLYEHSPREAELRTAIDRWVTHVQSSLPARQGRGGYAEEYGRCILFLTRAARVLKDPSLTTLARRVADEAVATLYVPDAGMFRSHPGEDRCDAVDGLGFLFLGMLDLETGGRPDPMGLGF